jgi:hypothetical protein
MRSAGHSRERGGAQPAGHGLLRIGQTATMYDPYMEIFVIQYKVAQAPQVSPRGPPNQGPAEGRCRYGYTGSCFSYPAAPVSLHDTSTRSLRVAEYAIVINCSDGTAALLSNRSRRPSGIVM